MRYSKTTGSGDAAVTHIHAWDGQNIVAEIGVTDTVNSRYIRGQNLVARKIDSNHQYYQFNAHGDVLHLLDANGNMLVDYRYDAFGNQSNPVATDTNPFRYCGEYYDRETGNYYLRARNYNPFTGRFTTEDAVRGATVSLVGKSFVEPISLNLYLYCKHNPIRFVDLTGFDPTPQWAQRIIAGRGTIDDYQTALSFYRSGSISAYAGFAAVAIKGALEQSIRVKEVTENLSFPTSQSEWTTYVGHTGIDFTVPSGTPVTSIADGTVVFIRNDYPDDYNIVARTGVDPNVEVSNKAYANRIVIEHIADNGEKYYSMYAHLLKAYTPLSVGDTIKAGDWIGNVGNTGRSYGSHLHFEIRTQMGYGYHVSNPEDYLP